MANRHARGNPKGSNGGVHRGKNVVPTGSIRLLYRVFLHEKREDIWKALEKALKKPSLALQLVQDIGDRLEGKPKQSVEHSVKRTSNFIEATKPAALTPPPEEPLA